jgi:hypothetical protein
LEISTYNANGKRPFDAFKNNFKRNVGNQHMSNYNP